MNGLPELGARPVLEARGLTMRFGPFCALDSADFSLHAGRALALVGESGSGKSTCAKLLTHVLTASAGHIFHAGRDVTNLSGRKALLEYRAAVQMVFQDPFAALNPAHNVEHHLTRPLALHRPDLSPTARRDMVAELLRAVDLDPAVACPKFPHEMSGGQRQRVNLARALAVNPSVIIADEPTSMLDVSIRLSVLDTFRDLKRERGIAMLYITHDIATARYVAEETAVIFRGRIVERGPTAQVIDTPRHPYTRLLLAAVPEVGSPFGAGNSLAPLAAQVRESCDGPGELREVVPGHWVREAA
ncbi:ABC transporter ATP-binding protein [Niveispirillum sp. KHB5.9]|uniref:ABC transporter ATP-binding protein n=1 Tax=Niveispirillum sp. KHB5.9 TaxID=3400269 RepID=UPI003A8AE236